jgi:hypothetical protein
VSLIEEGTGDWRLTGSAFVVSAAERRIAITAEHVVRGPQKKFLSLSASGGLPWPREYLKLESVQMGEAPPDIALAIAEVTSAEPADLGPLPIDLLLPGQQFEPGTSMVGVGFPSSKAKVRGVNRTLATKLMSVVGDLTSDEVCERIGKSAATHLAMTFRQDACVDENSLPAPAARPKGMSGGPMFVAAYHTDASGTTRMIPRLVGVLVEHHDAPENVLVAVRIEVVLDALGIRPENAVQRFRAVDA